ncbi:MAG TPA: HAD hydrolase-like protein [Deltaproteobacteria bacterium]|nr:HAD hydrolase-like protein [Deltaproteobacteria bacterium]
MRPRGLIVFDMDGVIIDVSRSYRDTVRQTAGLFFKGAHAWDDLPNPLFPLADLARVKQSGGLNNDWDLTFVVINLLFTLLRGPVILKGNVTWAAYRKAMSRGDVSDLARFLRTYGMPLTRLLDEKGRRTHEFVTGLYTGDVGSGNIIKQIFQEIYLGSDLFESTYGVQAEVYLGEGYINKEKLLVDMAILEQLAENNILAIATGRPKAEADYPLDRFNIKRFFETVYTLDDCLKEEERILNAEGKKVSLSKPDPYMLDALAGTIKHEVSRCYYIGDMPDDMLAAAKAGAGFTGIGILMSSPDKERLREDMTRAGADHVIDDFKELMKIVQTDSD